MKTRLINEVGTRAFLRVYWGEGCKSYGCHNAMIPLIDSDKKEDWNLGGKPEDYPKGMWPVKCDHCGAEVSKDTNYQIHRARLYDNETGEPQPGDMFWAPWYHEPEWKHFYCKWDNCNDQLGHLIVILPNGDKWDTDGRASNCTMPEDRLHRCWVKHGEPPNVTVDKNGNTCQAGAGSILSGDYHGFLHNGELTNC